MPEGSGSFGLMLAGASPPHHRLMPSPRRRLGIAAAASLLLHALLLTALLVGLAHQKRVVEASETPAIVELVMSPPGSSHTTAPATAPPHVTQSKPVAKPVPPAPTAKAQPAPQDTPPAKPTEAAPPPVPAPTKAPGTVAVPSPPPQPPEAAQTAQPASPAAPSPATPSPPAPAAKPALQLSLGGIASDTNALVTGSMLLPPTADPKFRNRKPSYPTEAALRGEQGTVVLMVHVSPEGLVTGVDIAQSSGYRLLDNAARDAVLSWHFLPAIRAGQPARFDMPMRIAFVLD